MYKLKSGVEYQEIDGTVVLLCSNGDAAVLNTSAARMLSLLISNDDLKRVGEILFQEYEVTFEEVYRDLEKLLVKFLKYGLLYETKH